MSITKLLPEMPAPPRAAVSRADSLRQWIIGSATPVSSEVRAASLLTLREHLLVTVLGLFWAQTGAIAVWWIAGKTWALTWLAADLVLFGLRVHLGRRVEQAARTQAPAPYAALLVCHAIWMSTLALGTVGAASQADIRLLLIGVILPIGFNGYIVARWAALPRFAVTLQYLLWGALGVGLTLSPWPGTGLIAALTIAGGVAFHVLLRLTHEIILGALRAQQENRQLSLHDPLTHLPNRLLLRERLLVLSAQFTERRRGAGFAVLCLDVDGFKTINDRHGHAAGDWLLKRVAALLRAAVRAQDLVARIGGDEFVILLPGADAVVAGAIAQRIVDAAAEPQDLGGIAAARASVSIGIALAPQHGRDPDALLAAGDEALYSVKRSGKNGWRIHTGGAAPAPTRGTACAQLA